MSLDFPLIVADESVDARLIKALTNSGYSVYSIVETHAGISDIEVIGVAARLNAYILTEDKDFGDQLIYRQAASVGGMLLRLSSLHIAVRIELLLSVLTGHKDELLGNFAVLNPSKLRIRKYNF